MLRYFILASFLVTCFSSLSFARLSFREIADRLRYDDHDYSISGTICEQVARINLEDIYKRPEYVILTGIVYLDRDETPSRILGELDVVVFRTKDMSTVLIGEVKCWTNAEASYIKAIEQKDRFIEKLKTKRLDFYLNDNHKIHFTPEQFSQAPYITISYKGTQKLGFDYELDYSLQRLQKMGKRILNSPEHQIIPPQLLIQPNFLF